MVYLMNLYIGLTISGYSLSDKTNNAIKWAWCNNLGNALFENIKFKLNSGTTYLDELTSDTMAIEA